MNHVKVLFFTPECLPFSR